MQPDEMKIYWQTSNWRQGSRLQHFGYHSHYWYGKHDCM